MAFSETAQTVSIPAGSTFGSTSLYKFVFLNGSGQAVVSSVTTNAVPFGVLYGVTSTSTAQAVPVAVSGVVKVQMGASTLAAGGYVGAAASGGLGIVPTTDSYIAGQIVSGSSGSAGRIHSVKLFFIHAAAI